MTRPIPLLSLLALGALLTTGCPDTGGDVTQTVPLGEGTPSATIPTEAPTDAPTAPPVTSPTEATEAPTATAAPVTPTATAAPEVTEPPAFTPTAAPTTPTALTATEPTATPIPPTATPIPPTATPIPPTATPTEPATPTATAAPGDRDGDGDGYSPNQGDCDDALAGVYPGADETPYDGIDQDCSGADLTDVDGDGFDGGEGGADCDDASPAVYPGADETPYDGVDQDCSGADLTDVDGDGYDGGEGGDDCDDADAALNPGAEELCNLADDDCDSVADEGLPPAQTYYADSDGDGFGDEGVSEVQCGAAEGFVDNALDCDDTTIEIYPGGSRACPVQSCEAAVALGTFSTSGTVWVQPADAPLRVFCDLDHAEDVIGLRTSDGVAQMTAAQIQLACPAGLAPYRYLDGDYVDAAIAFTSAEHAGDYYLLNSYAGEELNCPALAPFSGALDLSGAWFDDGLDLAVWGLNISANCNLGIYDPIPLHYTQGPRPTTGTNVLHNNTEDGRSLPVLCMEIYNRDGDQADTREDCDDHRADVYPGAEEVADGVDQDCDGLVDEGIVGSSCVDILDRYPLAPNGVYSVDPDGEGPMEVYCNMTLDGGGWQLISVRHSEFDTLFADALCTSLGGNCSGTIPDEQVLAGAGPELLFALNDESVWLTLTGVEGPGVGGVLDVITLDRLLSNNSTCAAPHYCNLTPDVHLAIGASSSGYTPRFADVPSQYARYGGLWFGKNGGSVDDHVVSMNYIGYNGTDGGMDFSDASDTNLGNVATGEPGGLYFRY